MDNTRFDTFTRAYVECMLWSSTLPVYGECPVCKKDGVLDRGHADYDGVCADCSDNGAVDCEPPADDNYSFADLADVTVERIVADCEKFQREQTEWLISEYRTYADCVDNTVDSLAGHDFWLTRNGHGAGFWDGDWEEQAGRVLTEASKKFGEVNLYVGDDGRLYLL